MICPNNTFHLLAPHLPKELISLKALSYIQKVVNMMPQGMSSFILECRLESYQSQVDLGICFQALDGGRKILTDSSPHFGLPKSSRKSTLWKRIESFCFEWSNPSSHLNKTITAIWLEFDLDQPSGRIPVPSIFCTLRPSSEISENDLNRRSSLGDHSKLIEKILKFLLNGNMSSTTLRQIQLCSELLPIPAQLEHIGAMLPRSPKGIRIVCKEVPGDQLLAYLRQINWNGSLKDIEVLLHTFSPFMNYLKVGLDVDNEIIPKLGLEFRFMQEVDPLEQWMSFLNHLVKLELCTVEKFEALIPWMTYQSTFCKTLEPYKLWRTINHIKITYALGYPIEAKVYLSIGPGLIPIQDFKLRQKS